MPASVRARFVPRRGAKLFLPTQLGGHCDLRINANAGPGGGTASGTLGPLIRFDASLGSSESPAGESSGGGWHGRGGALLARRQGGAGDRRVERDRARDRP